LPGRSRRGEAFGAGEKAIVAEPAPIH